MRCEDCLPLVEEYFDGEVEGTLAARMGAHLSACATCAAALDALSFEQEMYARYDRGLEVGPALWARVSAEIARETPPESPAPASPFLSRLRGQLAAALGALAVRPALASSLALLLVGVTAGSLWLARRGGTAAPAEVAANAPVAGPVARTPAIVEGGVAVAPSTGSSNVVHESADPAPAESLLAGSREVAAARGAVAAEPGGPNTEDDVERLLATPPTAPLNPNIVVIRADEHAGADDAEALFVNASAPARDALAGGERLPEPGEKDVARHVERTQMLLRSFKNARGADEGSGPDVAYERELSRRLLAENSTLQLEAEVKGDKETKQVLDQIEPFLLDIANLRERPSREEVRSIGERVRKNEIVAALQVY